MTTKPRTLCTTAVVAAALIAPLMAGTAQAQERRYERNPHFVYDSRFHHNHYYPAAGYSVTVLPSGNVGITFRGGRFFYHSGVWFRPSGPGYVVVRPPVGIAMAVLPVGYTTLWARGVPYYYANDVYYVQGPGGYVVAEAPPEAVAPEQPPPAMAYPPQTGFKFPSQTAPDAQQPAPGSWYYCESAKGYYPYVPECREGWRTVPAAPPR
jgi:Family of unknown function (DUF6515)